MLLNPPMFFEVFGKVAIFIYDKSSAPNENALGFSLAMLDALAQTF